jgi:multiple sugar transport system ATP-binding protein
MRAEIILLRSKIDSTFIYVTHDQTEAMTLGDRIVIMKDGFIMQVGTPEEVFDRPHNLFVAEFIGAPKMNTFPARLNYSQGEYSVNAFGTNFRITGQLAELLRNKSAASKDVILGVRPEHIVLTEKATAESIECKILVKEMMGSELHLHLITEDGTKLIVIVQTIDLSAEQRNSLISGAKVHITFESKVMHLFDPETQKNLVYGKEDE